MAKSMVEQLEAFKLQVPELEEKIVALSDEITALKAENADHVEKATASDTKITELEASLETSKTEAAAALEVVVEEKAELEKQNGDLQAKIQVNPNLGDITAGANAVDDASVVDSDGGDDVDHKAEMEKIQAEKGSGSPEAIAYFREHQEAIEAADKGDK